MRRITIKVLLCASVMVGTLSLTGCVFPPPGGYHHDRTSHDRGGHHDDHHDGHDRDHDDHDH